MTTLEQQTAATLNPNLAIYTTFCGTSENFTFSARRYTNYPSYFISNNTDVLKTAEQGGWVPLFLEGGEPVNDPIISATQAKFAKALPHRFPELEKYDFLFYVDDKYKIAEVLIPGLAASLRANRSPMAMKHHPWLPPNVLYEYTESLFQKKYCDQRQRMMDYIASQLREGLKIESKFHYATGCILRDMRHPDTKTINEVWFSHIQQCGIECQISFFFTAQLFPNITLLPAFMLELPLQVSC
jgi:hypothetical protein